MADFLQRGDPHTDVEVSRQAEFYFLKALKAMREWDARRLSIWLRRIVFLPTAELQQAIAVLPRTMISEFLRSLDPKRVAFDTDPTDESRISVGMYQVLSMGQHMDSYGTRKLFGRLLLRMNVLVKCADEAGLTLDPEDYISLFRAYGAQSDIAGAKKLWDQVIGSTQIRPGPEVLHEFIKVRFLIDPMYYGFDKTRVAVTPRNLHRKGYLRFHQSVRRLDRLRFNRQRKACRFGLDRSSPNVAVSVSRRVRGKGPIMRLFNSWTARRHPMTEEVMCSFMIGFARAGSLRMVGLKLLPAQYGILTQMNKVTGQITAETLAPTIPNDVKRPRHKRYFRRPTVRLMNTIVEVYCSNGQLSWAIQLLEYISREYQLPIPAETWFELLEWSHVLCSTSVSTAWKMAGWYQQIPAREATELVWHTMTQPPCNVQPGFDQFAVLLRSRISNGQFVRADDEFLVQMRALYDEQCARYEAAVFDYITTVRDGVDYVTAALNTYQRARFRKQQMWFALSEISKANLINLRAWQLTDSRAVRDVPDFVWGNAAFIQNPVRYRVATGYVSLMDPAKPFLSRDLWYRRSHMPFHLKKKGVWREVLTRPRRSHVLSTHALAEFKNSRLDPLPLLQASLDAVRLPEPVTAAQWHARRKAARKIKKESLVQRALERKLALAGGNMYDLPETDGGVDDNDDDGK
ncbi:hypothetical protein PG984_014318 [Apiospora sp. TS-2023a]